VWLTASASLRPEPAFSTMKSGAGEPSAAGMLG
jgi:hypothetical protein